MYNDVEPVVDLAVILMVIAFVVFVAAASNRVSSSINLLAVGLALVVASMLVPLL